MHLFNLSNSRLFILFYLSHFLSSNLAPVLRNDQGVLELAYDPAFFFMEYGIFVKYPLRSQVSEQDVEP